MKRMNSWQEREREKKKNGKNKTMWEDGRWNERVQSKEQERKREREKGGGAQEMEAKIEARGNQAAMKDSAIQDTSKPRRANKFW